MGYATYHQSPNKRWKKTKRTTRINLIPRDIIVGILARVAAHSLPDLLHAKLSCHEWNELGDDVDVYKQASLADFPVILGWKPESAEKKRKVASFLNKCMDAQNLEVLFRTGVVGYFSGREQEYALKCLRKAGNAGHVGAVYAISIISMLFMGGEHKEKGMEVLSAMKKSDELRVKVGEARRELISILKEIWIGSFVVHRQKPVFCTRRDHSCMKTGWDAGEENLSIDCTYCKCDFEISVIDSVLPSPLNNNVV
ncbi:unnamed protein product [Cuscuta epithymum]|uniref:At2g35280-like TPR domain-containing protein n=1 Tax=Cuscuta epithymum TaxID=186058 RepID=A0AAV0F3N9_9ASTE|nr:unnamed protein product [Cuscuta epithymum]